MSPKISTICRIFAVTKNSFLTPKNNNYERIFPFCIDLYLGHVCLLPVIC